VDPGLVLHLYLHAQVSRARPHRLDHAVLGLPRQVVAVEVKTTVVLHAPAGRPARLPVPHGLKQAASAEGASRQTLAAQLLNQLGFERVCQRQGHNGHFVWWIGLALGGRGRS